MNKIAEIRFGKVAYIYETTRTLEELRTLFIPATLLVDVTNIECAVGWKADFCNGLDAPNFIGPKVIVPPTPEELDVQQEKNKEAVKKHLLSAVDRYMDKTVQERGYDNIVKCATYEGDIDPVFNREGTAAKQWRSKVYRTCYNILAGVEAGYRPIPTVAELLDELPKIDWGD